MRKFLYYSIPVLFIFLCILEIITYYPERFKINKIETKLFKVKGLTVENCYLLETSNNNLTFKKGDTVLLGIRFGVEYLSLRHESFWNKPHAPNGFLGHTDEIVKMEVKCKDQIINANLLDASKYQIFNILDYGLMEHSLTGESHSCYIGNTSPSIKSFLKYYNNSKDSTIIISFCNYQLFRLSDSLVDNISDSCIKVSIKTDDLTTIESHVAKLEPQVLGYGYWDEKIRKGQVLVK